MASDATLRAVTGEVIKKLRKSKGISQIALAKKSRLSSSTISLLESGERAVSLETFLKIAQALEVDASVLLTEVEIRQIKG